MKRFNLFTPFVIAMALLFVAPATQALAEMAKWNLDKDHTTIGFWVKHMVVSKTKGKFLDYSGVVEMDAEAQQFKTIQATIQTNSVFTDHEKRDGHLKSPDFFDTNTFPTMTYTLKSYKKTGDTYTALGDLTIRGITKEITLVGTFNGVAKDPWGNTRAGFSGEGTINRQDFGMKFSKLLDNGGLMVGDEVHITLEVEVIKQKGE
ncbi:YceI family protein [Candidatus Nitronereus thalassa]|uniref:YceI family protein n=1 Tax=Candidatus Nitronereus thalassa TaxID=3020898 RepID=A0ABU3K3J0_9BACT|nr:YceI family protein [Candidatus Nitronereus thalassa]MDT7040954.1 YceI family protein [Candidatus Nitronereus thalassa]